ncbi:DUF1648 domain-containing protein [Peribacillus sp. NPDC097295]|uniref:DUF1648 domain-containing protein n=1 Tax=Peribacillus sp. NPDC097295 TaxID=3364402 RepID=UPI003827CAEF
MKKVQPVLHLPKTGAEKMMDIVSLLLIIINFIYLISVWNTLPEQVPIHFNGKGEVDGWGGRVVIWLLPTISLFLWFGLTIMERVPHLFNYPIEITEKNAVFQYKNARMMSLFLKVEIILILLYTSWESVHVAMGYEGGLGRAELPILLILILGSIAFFVIRSVRNAK